MSNSKHGKMKESSNNHRAPARDDQREDEIAEAAGSDPQSSDASVAHSALPAPITTHPDTPDADVAAHDNAWASYYTRQVQQEQGACTHDQNKPAEEQSKRTLPDDSAGHDGQAAKRKKLPTVRRCSYCRGPHHTALTCSLAIAHRNRNCDNRVTKRQKIPYQQPPVQEPSVQQLPSGKHCGWCKKPGHTVRTCAGPPAEDGFIHACPIHNTCLHTLNECPLVINWDKTLAWNYIVYQRRKLPPLAWGNGWETYAEYPAYSGAFLEFLRASDDSLPFTAEFAKTIDKNKFDEYDYSQGQYGHQLGIEQRTFNYEYFTAWRNSIKQQSSASSKLWSS
ncbi:zinc finger domain-containing protein [Apiospora arundinis]